MSNGDVPQRPTATGVWVMACAISAVAWPWFVHIFPFEWQPVIMASAQGILVSAVLFLLVWHAPDRQGRQDWKYKNELVRELEIMLRRQHEDSVKLQQEYHAGVRAQTEAIDRLRGVFERAMGEKGDAS